MNDEKVASFALGQVIHHRLFHYRGVIFDVDPQFQGTEEWFEKNVGAGNPSKDEPWYHVLIDQQNLLEAFWLAESIGRFQHL